MSGFPSNFMDGLILNGLQFDRKCYHITITHHYVNSLPKSLPNILLDIWHTMRITDFFELWGTTLVLEHRQIRPHVMLDLIVEPAVGEINQVVSSLIVGRADDLTYVKSTALGLNSALKRIDILTRMVSYYRKEGMNIGQKFGKKKGLPLHYKIDSVRFQELATTGMVEEEIWK